MTKVNYTRRDFLKGLSIGAASLTLPYCLSSCSTQSSMCKARKDRLHMVTLSFDDGFKKSSIRTAEIYEKYNLSACINVIATAHHKDFKLPNEYHAWPVADFGLWNELKARGHEIMPHSYKHSDKATMPFSQAKELILRCLDYFDTELEGFDRAKAVFNFPYNRSTPELEAWLPTQVMAFRTGGGGINPLPYKGQVKLTCTGFGPGNSEQHLDNEIEKLLALDSGWLVYNLHGLDDEGWGPVRSYYLEKLLERLSAIDSVVIIPAGKALQTLGSDRA
ncbi:MAG: polysaccharide deacetylase family protein [Planctomycetota bacterium]|nr:MAG: polysaccharide deacetylase family protein [Planctomycetota bacterium]